MYGTYGTHTRFLFFRRPLPNRHQYHRPRRLHHKLRLQRPMAARNHYRHIQYNSYDPLVQVCNWTNEDDESRQQTHYSHCNQIGIPREITNKDGNLLWFGNYTSWDRLKKDERVYRNVHQPFRLQKQYFDDQVLTMLAVYMINGRMSYEYRITY